FAGDDGPNDSEPAVRLLLEDHRGRVWAGTDRGLFEIGEKTDRPPPLGRLTFDPDHPNASHRVTALIEDSSGDLWIGSGPSLYQGPPGGRRARNAPSARRATAHPPTAIRAIAEDDAGHIGVGGDNVAEMARGAAGAGARLVRAYGPADGLPDFGTRSLLVAGGAIWVGTVYGLASLRLDATGPSRRFRSFRLRAGLARID